MMIMGKRICADILIFISIFSFPFWVSLVLIAIALFYFKNFYEALAAGVMIDALYGIPLEKFFNIQWVTTLLFLLIFLTINTAKQYTRFHEPR